MYFVQRVLYVALLLLTGRGLIVLSLQGAAPEKASAQNEFAEQIYHFDGETGKRKLPLPWTQNDFRTFKPLAETRIMDAPYGRYKKALRIISKTVPAHIYAAYVPVKKGDVCKVDVVFRSPDGKTPVQFGVYGEYQAVNCKPLGKNWDHRYAYFEVKNPKTKGLRVFITCPANATVDYAFASIKKLTPGEIKLVSPAGNLKLWEERTKGKNLAFRKKVKFHPAPDYYLTAKGNSDHTDLTDGKVFRGSGMLHFRKEAVGWGRQFGKISIMIDLGSVQPVKKAVLRINGGREGGLTFPKEMTLWGSRDGVNFFPGQKLTKLGKRENYLSNFKDLYYLPEGVSSDRSAPTYVYPFELELNARARYIGFQITPGFYSLYCDEIAVIEADSKEVRSPSFDKNSGKIDQSVFHESILARPKMDTFYICEELWYPNYLELDCRKAKLGGIFTLTVDLPDSVQYSHSQEFPALLRKHVKTEKKNGRILYHFRSDIPLSSKLLSWAKRFGYGPFYFRVKDREKIPAKERYVVFRTYCDDTLQKEVKLPVEFLKMPRMPKLEYINTSMWISTRTLGYWPDLVRSMREAGFTYLPILPDYPSESPLLRKYVKETKKLHNKFRLIISPVRTDQKSEFYCPTKGPVKTVCLAYRGKLYQDMLSRIRESVKKYPARYLTFDVESWEPYTMRNAMKCPRCDALRKKKKMSWVEYFSRGQADYIIPFRKAVHDGAKEAGIQPPKIGFYALTPGRGIFRYNCPEGPVDFLGGYKRMAPYLDEFQFSNYGKSAARIHASARDAYRVLKDPLRSNPWISGGTGAFYGPPTYKMVKHHFLEAVFNGSCGVQIFSCRSFESPLDYYHFAEAVREIAPFEELLMKGALDFNFKGSNTKLLYTKRDHKGKTLILIGNYGSMEKNTTVLPIRGKVTHILSGKKSVADGKYTLRVPADDYSILLVE